jgi:PKD repeat protein
MASGSNYSLDFHDITSGNNGYPAGAGWDPVTGLGSPRVANLVLGLAHPVAVPSSTVATFLYASPRFGLAPLTVHFHVNVTGGTGVYPLEGVEFGDGTASFAPGGNTTYTYEYPGVYAPQAYVADSAANYSVSSPLAIVVGGGRALSVTLGASTSAPAVGDSVQFSVTAAGGTAPYGYNYSFGDGTFLDGSRSSSTGHVYGARGSFCASVVVADSASPVDGAASDRVAIGVGGAPLPDCRNDTVPLLLTSHPNIEVRDAPADFPNLSAQLFTVTGGSTATGTLPPSLTVTSTDPYLAACNCTIFRSPGVYPVTAYASDSENEEATATVDVTVAPPLAGAFTATTTYGVAPLNVTFRASATGGYGTDAANTVWTIGNGSSVGATVSYTFSRPGLYVVLGHLSDLGHGNASRAFLIDVASPPGGAGLAPPYLTATVSPALDVPLGANVSFTAGMVAANGSSLPASILWKIGTDSGGFESSLNWTYAAPLPNVTGGVLNVTVLGRDLAGDRPFGLAPVEGAFHLSDFGATEANGFEPRVDALNLTDYGGPEAGPAPLVWSGLANVSGPGGASILWSFGPGIEGDMPGEEFAFGAGLHTVVLTVQDGWNDSATDVFPAAAYAPFGFGASLSSTNGAAPLTVVFRANASGGYGPPYQYQWSFGDGQGADTENTTHRYASEGSYTVTLTVTDPYGDSSTMQWTVTVAPAWSAFAPMIFLGVGVGVGVGAALVAAAGRRRSSRGTPTP